MAQGKSLKIDLPRSVQATIKRVAKADDCDEAQLLESVIIDWAQLRASMDREIGKAIQEGKRGDVVDGATFFSRRAIEKRLKRRQNGRK